MANKDRISDELLAAYLDGNTSKAETQQVLHALSMDQELQEVLRIAMQTNDEKRDNTKKHDPSLVSLASLPDNDEEYDRLKVSNITKPIKKLGLGTVKRKNKN